MDTIKPSNDTIHLMREVHRFSFHGDDGSCTCGAEFWFDYKETVFDKYLDHLENILRIEHEAQI